MEKELAREKMGTFEGSVWGNNWKQYEKSIIAYKTLKRVSEDLLRGH